MYSELQDQCSCVLQKYTDTNQIKALELIAKPHAYLSRPRHADKSLLQNTIQLIYQTNSTEQSLFSFFYTGATMFMKPSQDTLITAKL